MVRYLRSDALKNNGISKYRFEDYEGHALTSGADAESCLYSAGKRRWKKYIWCWKRPEYYNSFLPGDYLCAEQGNDYN